mmetsp:Transcript_10/g.39  ORF Transcript_10/g.39 Transcript_10/m.39 type:complete len:247 (+) Transcript_10:1755-2495(+)
MASDGAASDGAAAVGAASAAAAASRPARRAWRSRSNHSKRLNSAPWRPHARAAGKAAGVADANADAGNAEKNSASAWSRAARSPFSRAVPRAALKWASATVSALVPERMRPVLKHRRETSSPVSTRCRPACCAAAVRGLRRTPCIQEAPMSTRGGSASSPSLTVQHRPPTRNRASSNTTRAPDACSASAQARPARPAPMTTTRGAALSLTRCSGAAAAASAAERPAPRDASTSTPTRRSPSTVAET